MFALKPAPKSRPTPPDVILSVASRDFVLPEIAPFRFPVGTRSRRISLCIRPIRTANRTANASFESGMPVFRVAPSVSVFYKVWNQNA